VITSVKRKASSLANDRATQRSKNEQASMLTLQHSKPDWPLSSLSASNVQLLPVTPSEELSQTLDDRGFAHVNDVLESDLLGQIFTELKPWLDDLFTEMQRRKGKGKVPTGVTIELTPNGIRDAENDSSPLIPPPAFVNELLDRLLDDPCLGRFVQQLGHPEAQVHEAVYLRLRMPNHYTRVHSDYSFFEARNLLAAEPIGTVWIPLQTCDPASGALLLLPETHVHHSKSATQQAASANLNKNRWNSIGQAKGYSVWSAEMKAGSALLFSPTVVHGGALRADAGSGARYSMDLRILAKPQYSPESASADSGITERIAMVTAVTRLILQAAPLSDTPTSKSVTQVLNNTYIFALVLRNHSALRASLSSFFASVQTALRPHYETPLRPTNNVLDAQQRVQYRTIWPDSAAALVDADNSTAAAEAGATAAGAAADQVTAVIALVAADYSTFQEMLHELDSALSSDNMSTIAEDSATKWTEVLNGWTSTVCFQAIVDGHGHSPQLRGYCTQIDSLDNAVQSLRVAQQTSQHGRRAQDQLHLERFCGRHPLSGHALRLRTNPLSDALRQVRPLDRRFCVHCAAAATPESHRQAEKLGSC
jgi:hypothetical protein